ncbi:hypothetical protein LWI28_028635 [Acer negundo]|uniref:Uncharacterized protein n=1 Tax=Acer negundo TaxID=4023 RepID=A0AAD5IHN8_ACENE|nr:hypothetical protein LWI28_028635 [Acer negundo]
MPSSPLPSPPPLPLPSPPPPPTMKYTSSCNFQWITAEQMFVTTNLILEVPVPSVVFDKLSSVHKPQYALVSMLLSFMTMLICIIQLVYQGGEARVGWKRKGKIPWLYYPPPNDKPFGTVIGFIGLLCAIFQSIFTAIDYASYLQNINDPIKISIWPLVFFFCLACSTFFKESPKEASKKSLCPTCSSTESAVARMNNV